MAYFANGSDGSYFEQQCTLCKYGEQACPIAWVQTDNNYEACNNKVAKKILDYLVKDDGTCIMYETFKKDFAIEKSN